MNQEEKFTHRRLVSSYRGVIISISVMLYLLGLLLVFIGNTNSLLNNVKENIGIEVIVKDLYDEDELRFNIRQLYLKPFTKQVILTTNEEAAKDLADKLDEDFVGFIGYNPLPTSFELKVHSEYANPDSLKMIESYLNSQKYVKSVSTQEQIIRRLNNSRKSTSSILFAFVLIMVLIVIVIIHSTMKLTVFANRNIIKTMQTIGATTSFIRMPYIRKSLYQAVLGATFAVIALMLTLLIMVKFMYSDFEILLRMKDIIGIVVIIYVFGLVITLFTSVFAINKYLDIRKKILY